jgi:hypothetical protein
MKEVKPLLRNGSSVKFQGAEKHEAGRLNVKLVIEKIEFRMCRENKLEVTMEIDREYESGAWRKSFESVVLDAENVQKLADVIYTRSGIRGNLIPCTNGMVIK